MSKNKSFYITTTLPYVNAEPHIGHTYEFLAADVIARSKADREVFFNTGTDEHGQKIFNAAEKAGEKVEKYVERYREEFKKLKDLLNLSENLRFISTHSKEHIRAAQELWKRCENDIYQKEFEGLYCVGCERFLSKRDIVLGKCSIHETEPQLLKEKNWFFKFSKYEKDLLKYLANPEAIIPDWRRLEAIDFVNEGLEDFSISREKSRLSWGVPVPGDDTQVMYVWFDALTSYISTLGWPEDKNGDFKKFWEEGETLQLAGKDQIRFQSLMWQAMLMSAGIKNTDQIFYHGFINSGGQKMSKSLGNVISPQDMVNKYGVDSTRYLLLRHVNPFEDTDVTWERLDEWYEAGLANGLGNLTARIMKMAGDYLNSSVSVNNKGTKAITKKIDEFNFQEALGLVFSAIGLLDGEIQNKKPWETKDTKVITKLVIELAQIASDLAQFLPETSEKILKAIKENKKPENLFPRLS